MISTDDISVVIPTRNEETNISDTIASARDAGAGEIVVSDGFSDDQTQTRATAAGADRVIQAKPGRGSQLAAGAQESSGKILLFLHADNLLGPDSLAQVVRVIDDTSQPTWGAMHQRIDSDRGIYRCIEWGNAKRVQWRRMPFGDQAVFVQRELYDQVGGFDNVPLMEDVRLAIKLRKIVPPVLIPGPVTVAPRRWEKRGAISQTWLNWKIQIAHSFGVSEERLARWYQK